MKPKHTLRSFLLGCGSLLAASSLHAASLYWDGTTTGVDADGGDGTWDNLTTSNWDDAATAGADSQWNNANNDTAVFGGAVGTVTIAAGGVTVGGLKFDTAGYTIGGDVLTIGLAGSITANANATISSALAGSAAIEKAGTASLTLSGINTSFTGPWTLSAGTLIISNADSLGAGSVSVTGTSKINAISGLTYANNINVGATLTLQNGTYTVVSTNPGGTAMFSGVLSGSSSINLANSNSGNNTTILDFTNTANDFTGNVVSATGNANGADYFRFASIGDGGNFTFNKAGNRGGVIYAGSSNITFAMRQIALGTAFGNIINGNGIPINAFQNNGSGTVTFNTNMAMTTIASAGTFVFDGTNTGDNTFAGTIANPSNFNLGIGKWGAGKWILSGSNSYLGNVLLAQGTLSVGAIDVVANNQPLGKGSLVQLGNLATTGTLEFTGSTNSTTDKLVQMGNVNANGSNSGGGVILNNGSGSLTFTNSTFNQAAATVTATRTLTLGGTYTGTNEIQGIIQDNVATTGKVAITKSGNGVWKLSGDNTYTGTTTITAGMLLANNANAIPSGSAISINGDGSILGLAAGDFTRLPNGSTLAAGKITFLNSGGFAAYGADRTVNFGGSSDIVAIGSTATPNIGSLNGKTLILGASTSTHKITVTNTLDFGGAANRTIQVNDGAAAVDAEISGVLQPQAGATTAGFTKTGTGTLLLSNANTYTGGTTVTGGTLTVSGSLADATMSISSGATVNGTGTLTFNIDGTTADQVVNGGTINVSGLTVAVNATGVGLDQTEYVLVDATGGGTITGSFASVTGAPGYSLNYATPNQVKLVSGAPSDPYDTWAGGPGVPFDGDANGDGVSNGLAFLLGATDKNVSALNKLPVVSQTGGNLKLVFNCLTGTARGTAVLKVQYSKDLGITDLWDSHAGDTAVVPGTATAPTIVNVGGVDFVTGTSGSLLQVEATIPASAASPGTKLFGRLKAVKP